MNKLDSILLNLAEVFNSLHKQIAIQKDFEVVQRLRSFRTEVLCSKPLYLSLQLFKLFILIHSLEVCPEEVIQVALSHHTWHFISS